MRKFFSILGLALLALGLFAWTRRPDFSVNGVTDLLSDPRAAIAARDTNHDGQLDALELKRYAWMLLVPGMDADKNHKLSANELALGEGILSQNLFPSRAAPPATKMPPPFEPAPSVRQAPVRLKPAEWNIDTLVADVELQTRTGERRMLRSLAGPRGTVVAVLSKSCPISQRYAPGLARLAAEYAQRGVGFVLVAAPGEDENENEDDSSNWLRDPSGGLLRAVRAVRTTDVFVLDAAHTLIYRGAIDDQYGQGYSRAEPSQRYLVDALEALLAGDRPRVAATQAPGCELELPVAPTSDPAREITWHNRISRLAQAHCVTCHHDGGVAPFPLETCAQFLKKAGTVRRVVSEGVMPPWFAAPTAHTVWENDRSLTARELADLTAWLAGPRPEGDSADAPLPRQWRDDWQIGRPDLVVQIPQPMAVAAEGTMPYLSVVVETGLKEAKWISGWEIRPTARRVVHHVLVYVYDPAEKGWPGIAERHGQLAGYAPGTGYAIYPTGFAKLIPAGARLRFEIHYTPNGKPTTDQTQLGLKFAAGPPQYVVETAGVANVRLKIPPGAASHPEAAVWRAPMNIHLLGFIPHMHFRGQAMRFEATVPGGETRTLLDVPRYDFNWQVPVAYADPPAVPAGTLIKVTGWFDNSAANAANPDPAATVHWGSQTSDEMMIGYVDYYRER